MARITRRQLKEDKLLSTTAKLSIFLSEHWKEIVSAVCAIIVIIGTVVLYHGYVTRRNEKAARSFNEAKALFDEAESALESQGRVKSVIEKYGEAKAKFQEVYQSGGHTDTVSESLFYSAKCSYRLGRYDEALSIFQEFVDKYPKSILATHARKAIGECYEQLGDDESLRKAIQQYDELLSYPETYITLKCAIDKGRCYEKLKEWDRAIAAYKFITDKFKQNVELTIQAKSRSLVQKAKDVISKYRTALGGEASDPDFAKYLDEASAFEAQGQWFEALKAYDRAIFSRKGYWVQKSSETYSAALQDALDALREYEDASSGVIRGISRGRKFEAQGDWDNALRYYRGAIEFDFLPGTDLFEEARFRIRWISSVERPMDKSQQG